MEDTDEGCIGGMFMSKVMKKIIAFCFMAVLTIAMIPQTIKADEATDAKKAVYVQVPQDWENPCVWAWDDAVSYTHLTLPTIA